MRKSRALSLFVLSVLICAFSFTGCSGSSSNPGITLSPASGESLNPGETVTITATVANDKNNQGVSWSLSGPGSLSGNTTTSVVYTAPASLLTTTNVTITATSIANATEIATESITLNAVLTITTTSLPPGTLGVRYDVFVSAGGATGTFTWGIVSGSLPEGLTFLVSSDTASAEISGTPAVLGTSSFTVQVTDATGTSVTQPLSITINPPPPLSVATASLADGTVGTPYSQTLQASSGVAPYTWSLTNGTQLPQGLTLASNGVIAGQPTASGTSSFTVQVVDSSTPTPQIATANLTITIDQGLTNNLKLNGNYAFSVRGFDAAGLFVAAGSFFADGNGNISTGIMDTNGTAALPASQSFNGTYFIDDKGLGTMTFNITSGGSLTLALSMMASENAKIIEFDDNTGGGTRNSGVLLKQTTSAFSTSSLTGSYAFGFLGIDSGKNRFGMAGDLHADGAGNFTNGLLDSDDSSSGPSSSVAFTGTYSVASTGRGLATITTAQGTTNYSFYVVNATELLAMEIDPFPPGGEPLVSGSILLQAGNSDFNATSVFRVGGLDPSGPTAESQIGLFEAIAGAYSMTSDQNSGGTLTSPTGSGYYSVSNGRVTLSGSGFQNSPPVLYLVSANQAFIIGTDSAVSFGFMTPQSGVPFSTASLSGTYAGGSLAPVDPSVSNVVSIAVAGSGNLTITADISSVNGLIQNNQVTEDIASVATDGRVVVTENGNTAGVLYLVSPAQFFALSTDASARVDIFEQ